MSTKVYTAYRMKDASNLWTWVRKARPRGMAEVKKALRVIYTARAGTIDPKSEEYRRSFSLYENDQMVRLSLADREIYKEYRDQATSSMRDMYDFNVSISIRELEGSLYLIPYCDMLMRNTLDFLKKDRLLEDFAYWNNSDEPDHVTRKEWEARGRVWDRLDDFGPKKKWLDYLTLEICTPNGFRDVSPFREMMDEIKEAKLGSASLPPPR